MKLMHGEAKTPIANESATEPLHAATGSTAPTIEEMNKLAWEIASDVAYYGMQGFTAKEIAELWKKGHKWSGMIRAATAQQNDQSSATRPHEIKP